MTLHSENTRLEIHNPRVLNNALQTRHELQMRRVLLNADIGRQLAIPIHEGESNNLLILPILSILKLANKAVAESSLVNEKKAMVSRLFNTAEIFPSLLDKAREEEEYELPAGLRGCCRGRLRAISCMVRCGLGACICLPG